MITILNTGYNLKERIKMVKAMEFIVRQINNEDFIIPWLYVGVADGDIEYGDLSDGVDDAISYTDDETFKELMSVFLRCMAKAKSDGGLYCDGIMSE